MNIVCRLPPRYHTPYLGVQNTSSNPEGRLSPPNLHYLTRQALHTLSLDHYRVFILNQECVRHVRAQGKEMGGHLSSLLTEVHGLGAEFSVFQREAAELVGGHKRNRQTLKHHMQVLNARSTSFILGFSYGHETAAPAAPAAPASSSPRKQQRFMNARFVCRLFYKMHLPDRESISLTSYARHD